MRDDFPNDSDGDALRRLVKSGNDLSKPILIDFQVAVPDEDAANGLADVAWKLGYRVAIYASQRVFTAVDVRVFDADAPKLRWRDCHSVRVG